MSYMIQNKLISKLIDFFMENESPLVTQNKKRQTMGSNYAQPPLENVILIISLIVRNYKWINLTPDQQNIIVPDPSICSVYFMGH